MKITDTEGVLIEPLESHGDTLEEALEYINMFREPYRTQRLADRRWALRFADGLRGKDREYIMNLHKQAKAKLEKESTMKSQNNDDADDEVSANIAKEYEGMSVSAISKSVNRISGTFVKSGAFAKYLTKKLNKETSDLRIVVAHDSDTSTNVMCDAAIKGLLSQGAHVIDCGLCNPFTLSQFISEKQMPVSHFDGAIWITASHLRDNIDGLRFITPFSPFAMSKVNKHEVKEILTLAATLCLKPVSSADVTVLDLKTYFEDSFFSCLTMREKMVLPLRLGLTDGRCRTLEEIGMHFNVTRDRIRQIEGKALAKIRNWDQHRDSK